jgi:hypothetical protein
MTWHQPWSSSVVSTTMSAIEPAGERPVTVMTAISGQPPAPQRAPRSWLRSRLVGHADDEPGGRWSQRGLEGLDGRDDRSVVPGRDRRLSEDLGGRERRVLGCPAADDRDRLAALDGHLDGGRKIGCGARSGERGNQPTSHRGSAAIMSVM